MIMNYLPGVPYAHTKPALGVQKRTSRATSPSPVDARVVRDRDASEAARGTELEPADDDAAFRRPPAAASRPDPARALAPGLLLDQGAARRPGAALLGERATAGAIAEQYEHSTASTSRSTCSTAKYTEDSSRAATSGSSVDLAPAGHDEIRQRFPATIELAIGGDDLRDRRSGSRSASSPPSATVGRSTTASLVGSLLGISIPIFFLALILKYIFAVKLGWLPSVGRDDVLINPTTRRTSTSSTRSSTATWAAFWDVIKHLILPAIALGSIPLAIITRITRASVLDVQNEDYVRTARAKGLSPADRRPPPRPAERDAADHDDHRPPDGPAALGRRADRDVFACPGHRHLAARTAIYEPRLPGAPGRHPLPRDRLRARQPRSSTSRTRSSTRRIRYCHECRSPRSKPTSVALEAPTGGLWRDAWTRLRAQPGRDRRLRDRRRAIFVIAAIFAPLIAPHDRRDQRPLHCSETGCCPGPSADHWFGVDKLGRDEFSRIVYGARYSLLIGVVSVVGRPLARAAPRRRSPATSGGASTRDHALMDIMLAIPGLLLAIGIVAMLGPGLWQIMIAVGVVEHPDLRAARCAARSSPSGRTTSCSRRGRSACARRTILVSHILPNAISPVIVQATLALATAIIDVAAPRLPRPRPAGSVARPSGGRC